MLSAKRLVKVSVSLLYYVVFLVPLRLFGALVGKPMTRLTVLYYHGVPTPARAAFARQMDMLVRAGRPVGVDPEAAGDDSGLLVAVSFDDAFANLIENALPELESRGIPAAIFVPSGNLGRQAEWNIPEGSPEKAERIMTAEELRNLVGRWVTIGSHTVSHVPLADLSDEEAEVELLESKRELEEITGRWVDLLAFPYGSYSARIVPLARQAGYRRCYTIEPHSAHPRAAGFLVGRVKADPADRPIEFRLKIRGAYGWLAWFGRLKAAVGRPPAAGAAEAAGRRAET
ncbi:MAG: polysaccharide deacetylase family protein [Planctomycetes bacterium]|nr:polysaccharide deacetylase family protein [Planctomycetota bacterium]